MVHNEHDEDTGQAVEKPTFITHEERARVERVAAYEGRFSEHLVDLCVYIQKVGGVKTLSPDDIAELAATVLKRMEELAVVDWKTRASTLASVRLAIKRSAKLFSEDFDNKQVQKILDWLTDRLDSGTVEQVN